MTTIFDLGNIGRALIDALEEAEGELCPELERFFDELADAKEDKLESYCFVLAELEARAEAQKQKAKEILERAKANENQVARLKARLKTAFEVYGWSKEKAGAFTVALQANGGLLPIKWRFDDEPTLLAWVPERFIIKVPKVDREGVRKALADGEELDFAELGDRGSHIRVR